MLPRHYQYLAIDAFEQNLMSEGMLMRFLRADLVDVWKLIAAMREESVEAGHMAMLPQESEELPMQEVEQDRSYRLEKSLGADPVQCNESACCCSM